MLNLIYNRITICNCIIILNKYYYINNYITEEECHRFTIGPHSNHCLIKVNNSSLIIT